MSDETQTTWNVSAQARRLHEDALVWDDHAGFIANSPVDFKILEPWRRAGVNYLSLNVGFDVFSWQETIKNIAAYLTALEKHSELYTLVGIADDILAAKQQGKMAVTFDIEGMNALNGDDNMVLLYYRMGVRQMLFAYNRNNLAGGGCHDDDQGLTDFGRRVILKMNRVGMLIDCSHTGYRTTMEAMQTSSAPVIFSHSNPMTLHKHGRNIVDEQILACAATGGVIGINGIGRFLADSQASTETLVDCISYVADLVGTQHVGIALDYYPDSIENLLELNPEYWPASIYGAGIFRVAEPKQFPEITEMLLGRGWSEKDIQKVLGGNFLRVARSVWK